jgi:methylase of polypeptide subunit release factors
MNQEQEEQIRKQLVAHEHDDYTTDLELTEGVVLEDFKVDKNVFRADITFPRYFARWLFFNQDLYEGKKVLDVGCGTGILGIVMALYGASKVDFTDLSPLAVNNTQTNLAQFNLESKVMQGDLFENISEKYDIVVFNHPFFPGDPLDGKIVSNSMLGGKELFPRFLEEAKDYLLSSGTLLTTYWDFAGLENNPKVQGPKRGYKVNEKFTLGVGSGLQQGVVSIYELRK